MSDKVDGGWQQKVGQFAESTWVQRLIMVLIVLNGATLGAQTDQAINARFGEYLHLFDVVVIWVFVAEIAAKFVWRRMAFFSEGWNVFDFLIVALALLPAAGPLSVLRALRILRILRLMSVVPQMRRVVGALFTAIPGIASVGMIILLLFYVSAVLTTNFFGAAFPQWFGTIGESMYSLFQIMTLESWSMGIVRPVMVEYPYAWVFFVPFILITSFAILNLFIGIIVDAMQAQHLEEEKALHADSDHLEAEIKMVRSDIADLRSLLEDQRIRDRP